MSLIVDVYNKITNKAVLIKSSIVVDDSFDLIKLKLFYLTEGIEMHPNFIKLETTTNIFTPGMQLTSNILYATNILDVFEKEYNVPMLYQMFENNDYAEIFSDITVNKGYVNLTEDDLEFTIKVTLLKSSPSLFGNFQSYVEEYLQKLLNSKSEVYSLKDHFENLQNYYANLHNTFVLDPKSLSYNQVHIVLSSNENKGRFVKLLNIFNTFELSKEVPLVAIENSSKVLVKVFNDLLNYSSDKQVKSWLLNEKKKAQQVRYKKIKGLMFKIHHLDNFYTANLLENGTMHLKAEMKVTDSSFDTILDVLKTVYSKIVTILNNASNEYGYYNAKLQLDTIQNMTITIESLTATVDTPTLIDKTAFSEQLYNPFLSEYLFKLKDTIAEDVLSVLYTKSLNNITINIKDNPYKMNSSLITIYGANSPFQISSILLQILVVQRLSGKTDQFSQKLKEKSHIKNLRQQGVNILSTKCQKPRQPVLESNEIQPLQKSYTLEYQGKKYVCPKKDYPYPGFTNENIICCFKKDQRRRDAYIRNTLKSEIDVLVQPSNFKVDILENGLQFSTLVIKIVSDYEDGLNDQNAVSSYYYLSPDKKLVAITNKDITKKLNEYDQQDSTIWLEAVPLTRLITEPPKNKCNFAPDLTKQSPCEHHDKNKHFGYNLNSYPCCFDKERDPIVTRKRKELDITKQHIIKSDKILDNQRLGLLPEELDAVLKESSDQKLYYRMGVVQNNTAFLNTILLSMQQLNTTTELINNLITYLEQNKDVFPKLNAGSISLKYKTLENFIDTLKNKSVHWKDTLDLASRAFDINIFVLNIPYKMSESTQIPDYNNMKIICAPKSTIDKNRKSIILLKRQSAFEIIITLDNGNGKVVNTHDSNSTLVKLLSDYTQTSCVREKEYPNTFKYDPPYTISKLENMLQGSEHELIGQVSNSFNKVEMVITKKAFLIPVEESGIHDNLKTVSYENILTSRKLNDLQTFVKHMNEVNQFLKPIRLYLKGYTTDNDNNVNAVLSNFGLLIPIKNSESNSRAIGEMQKLPFSFYSDVDNAIQNLNTTFNEQNEQYTYLNEQNKYSKQRSSKLQDVLEVKRFLAKYISKNEKAVTYVNNIITKTNLTQFEKIQMLFDLFSKLSKQLSNRVPQTSSNIDFLFKVIAKEVLDEGSNGNFVNNIVINNHVDDIPSRSSESVLLSLEDIKKWITQYSVVDN